MNPCSVGNPKKREAERQRVRERERDRENKKQKKQREGKPEKPTSLSNRTPRVYEILWDPPPKQGDPEYLESLLVLGGLTIRTPHYTKNLGPYTLNPKPPGPPKPPPVPGPSEFGSQAPSGAWTAAWQKGTRAFVTGLRGSGSRGLRFRVWVYRFRV